MKNLIIIGARGFGREYHNGLKLRDDYGKDFIIKGFLDDKKDVLDGFENYAPILNSVEDYLIEPEDVFVCALGDSFYRRKYVNMIKEKGGTFFSIISSKSIIHPNAQIGEGVMISAFCNISSNTVIGDFTTIQPYCNIGHDAVIGDFCSLESYSFMGGFSRIGDNVTLHTRATILPHVKIGDNSIVGAGSVVLRNVKSNITVFGVPAKKISF
ncbi:acetyltransferase [Bacteroides intestinalis]|jgi:sugar O-acyltransferase (sialic acid O-acetyltransferase NeuD family)|uniref:Sialic acid O-acetyltransferase n=1 Tax=Bacteroides intestinalis TaxID=329854 RepID=A0A415N788_9BACE|nr:acetyltransferase [Bacteroides intestinalis]RHL91596.1 sialic acid O-acetyltransferase [Bacteroides intestinalis]